jgi:hypothetical protein
MAKKATRPGARKNGFKATWTRFANKRGSRGRARFGDWRKILMHKFVPERETPDPVSPDLDSRTGFRHREWQKCWRLIKPGR